MRKLTYFYVWMACLLLTSCHRRPLLQPNGDTILKVHLVTDSINNVTCNIYNENIECPVITSDMLRVFLYDKAGSPLLMQKFISDKSIDDRGFETLSGSLPVLPGLYGLLAYNFDVDATYIADEGDINTVRAYTEEISRTLYTRFGSRSDAMGKVYYQPEHVMVAANPSLRIDEHHDTEIIEMDAHTVINTYYIQIRISGYKNLASNAAALAVLSGLSQSVLLKDGTQVKEPASVYFELQRSKDSTISGEVQMILCAVFNTFGRIEQISSELQVTFTALTKDGKTHQKVVDMVPVFETEDARLRNWLLIDETWEIPSVPGGDGEGGGSGSGSGGGFGPMVDAWEDIEELIPL